LPRFNPVRTDPVPESWVPDEVNQLNVMLPKPPDGKAEADAVLGTVQEKLVVETTGLNKVGSVTTKVRSAVHPSELVSFTNTV
jgi:hypothetical protein